MPPAGYPAFLQYLQSGRVSHVLTSDPSLSDQSSRFNPGRHCLMLRFEKMAG